MEPKAGYHSFAGSAPVRRSDRGIPIIRSSTASKVRRFKNQAFWAHQGRIYIEDEVSGEFRSHSIKQFAAIVLAMARQIRVHGDSHERLLLTRMTGDARDVLHEAILQGDPHNRTVLAAKLRINGRGYTKVGGWDIAAGAKPSSGGATASIERAYAEVRDRTPGASNTVIGRG